MGTSNMRALVREIANLKTQVNNMTSPGLKFASVEQGGTITVREPVLDEYGNPALNADGIQEFREVVAMGSQWDGSYAAVPLTSGQLPPPTPTTPEMIAVPGGLVIKWDGLFTDSLFAPMNFSRIETHVDTQMGFDASFADTIVGTTSSPRASYVVMQGLNPSATYYGKLVCRDQAGARGPDSGENFINPLPVGTDQETRDAIAAAIAGAEAAQAAADQASADAAVAQETATGAAETADQASQDALDAKTTAESAGARATAAVGTANDAALQAREADASATTAITMANGKNTVTYSPSWPPFSTYRETNNGWLLEHNLADTTVRREGDMWFLTQGAENELVNYHLRYGEAVFDGRPGWVSQALQDSAIAELNASKITTGLLGVGQRIITGDSEGTHTELGSSALSVYRKLKDDQPPEATITLGGADDSLWITNSDIGSTYGFSSDGAAYFGDTEVDHMSIGGNPIGDYTSRSDLLFRLPWGRVAGYRPTRDSAKIGTSAYGICEVSGDCFSYRVYRVSWEGNFYRDSAGLTRLFLYWTVDGSAPTVNSPQLTMGIFDFPQAIHLRTRISHEFFVGGTPLDGPPANVRILLAAQSIGSGTTWYHSDSGNTPGALSIEDIGPNSGLSSEVWSDGLISAGGGTPAAGQVADTTPATGRKTHTKTYKATWSRTWRGSSVESSPEIRQGHSGGYLRSTIGLPTRIQSDLSGSSIAKLELYLYANHWYYHSGGTLFIGSHGSSTYQSTFPGSLATETSAKWSTKSGGKWITLPASWYPYFANGTYKGITIGGLVSSQSSSYYARINGYSMSNAPQLRATYVK